MFWVLGFGFAVCLMAAYRLDALKTHECATTPRPTHANTHPHKHTQTHLGKLDGGGHVPAHPHQPLPVGVPRQVCRVEEGALHLFYD